MNKSVRRLVVLLFLVALAVFFLLHNLSFSTEHVAQASSLPRPADPIQVTGEPRSGEETQAAALTQVYVPIITRQAGGPSLLPSNDRFSNLVQMSGSVARYEKFEVQFDVQTPATNPDWPYEPNPPVGIVSGTGITVEGLFSPDHWQTTFSQPAFWYQPYVHSLEGRDHFTPDGAPHWAVRFAPQQAGSWEYRLRVQDAQGTDYYPDLTSPALPFQVAAESQNIYIRKGFLRVSPTDPRYFEFQDGTPFTGVGFNTGFRESDQVDQMLTAFEQNKMNFMRVWMSGAGINGSQWTSWTSPYLPNDAYLPGVNFDIDHTYQGADVSMRLDDQNACFFTDFAQGGIPVEPQTVYDVSARIMLDQVSGPAGSGDYGFVIKQAGWLGTDCNLAGNGFQITQPQSGSTGWTTVQGTYTTGANQYWLDYLYLALQNTTAGNVYIDEVHVWRADDPNRVDLLREPNANSHLYFDPMSSALWDVFIDLAQQHGVYLKLVVDEKNEWIRNHIGADGQMTPNGGNDLFYAQPGTKVRWLQQVWWRYLIARWGYSTAIHSFEYVNEGDPYNSLHYDAADAMAGFMHALDPNRHMVTTSFWGSFPNAEFWSNPQYPNVDYADLHAYISTGWGLTANFLDPAHIETDPADVRSAPVSARIDAGSAFSDGVTPRGVVIQGIGEWIVRYWMKAEGFSANCPYNSSGGMQRVRWQLDGGTYHGGSEGVVPFNAEGKDFICTSPSGSFDWREFRSDRDRDGNLLPLETRLVLNDDSPHALSLAIENSQGAAGTAWMDDVQLINPDGEVLDVLGSFDTTPLDEDTAWYNRAYGELFGWQSGMGVNKPLVRGETGIDFPDRQEWNPDLLLDVQGIWLHNNLWGQISSSGMADLFWWASETIPESLYGNYLTYQDFMAGIPLNNGSYYEIRAQTSAPDLRVWGQRDDDHNRMHLWIQNRQHTWKRVVFGPGITPVSGTVTLLQVANGQYQVEWWNTYDASNPIVKTEVLSASGGVLSLTLPDPLIDDVAVKITRLP